MNLESLYPIFDAIKDTEEIKSNQDLIKIINEFPTLKETYEAFTANKLPRHSLILQYSSLGGQLTKLNELSNNSYAFSYLKIAFETANIPWINFLFDKLYNELYDEYIKNRQSWFEEFLLTNNEIIKKDAQIFKRDSKKY